MVEAIALYSVSTRYASPTILVLQNYFKKNHIVYRKDGKAQQYLSVTTLLQAKSYIHVSSNTLVATLYINISCLFCIYAPGTYGLLHQ